jgi:hypothetical protein
VWKKMQRRLFGNKFAPRQDSSRSSLKKHIKNKYFLHSGARICCGDEGPYTFTTDPDTDVLLILRRARRSQGFTLVYDTRMSPTLNFSHIIICIIVGKK